LYEVKERKIRMSFLFGDPAIRPLNGHQQQEVETIISELIRIGRGDDFLSLSPGGDYDIQCHHRQARDLGKRLYEMGGIPLMQAVRRRIQRKLKSVLAEHLDHCWKGIGTWQP